ncbi:hypothetical protein [Sedimenticola sp.]|uniref:hypothetical protein n=1 Tax=Sedimenticola sp. TaxID=1940285 RepID=UPI003D0F12A6
MLAFTACVDTVPAGEKLLFSSACLPVLLIVNEGTLLIDWIFLLVTGMIAYHALTHRNEAGDNDIGHLLFGSIALLFFVRVLFVDILRLI